jgi:branched-chain amino acid transport system ATP-binding protein
MSLLEVHGLVAGYGVPVIHDVNLDVDDGELVCVIGSNGAGKSTLLRTISGLTTVTGGTVTFAGDSLAGKSPEQVAAAGIAHVPENRRVFSKHSVEENLRLGGWVRRRHSREIEEDLERVYSDFPVLRDRRGQAGGTLSGGEQQMLAIGMALMARPRLLMLDEPSLGLAPLIVERMFEEISQLRSRGTTILLVEQLANKALEVADRGIVLQLGHIVGQGTARELEQDESVQAAYLGH